MIPVIIAVKILNELDAIRYLAIPLAPVMFLVGLPPEMGLVWATAMLNNIYGGIIVLFSLPSAHLLSTAQATVLGTMILVAHTLPVEVSIAQKSGARPLFQLLWRIGSAIFLGMVLHLCYSYLGVNQEPASMILPKGAPSESGGIGMWVLGEISRLLWILAIIAALVAMMRILRASGAMRVLDRVLRPLLGMLGIGPKASAITVIGITMGLAYGGGLIIQEARSGELGPRDVFFSLSLMGLAHSLIEDTLLIVTMGGALSGILLGRVAYGLFMAMVIVRLVERLPLSLCERFLWKKA
jgi:hypothetical protein